MPIIVDPDEFDEETALAAAEALQLVLERRTHQRKHLGQMVTVAGSLGAALNVPNIIAKLNSKVVSRRSKGLDEFADLWMTLSVATQEKVLEQIDWYDPKQLDWEDKRSNRKLVTVPPNEKKPK